MALRAALLVCISLFSQFGLAQFTQVVHGFELTGNPTGHSPGLSWFDYDHDGWDDLTVAQGGFDILVFHNVNGTLTLQMAFSNATQVKSIQWVDYDNDGDSDFFVCAANAACKLWQNNGAMVFTDVSANLNLPNTTDDAMGSAWGDYDNDGFLDVYVCNYYTVNWLLHNNGDGTFTNVALEMGVTNSNRPTYMCSWVDFNNDCLLDLFVTNDANTPTEMYQNTGNGFEPVGAAIGLAIVMDGMGVTWSDYDNDADIDVYLTNIVSGNKLMRNDGGVFTDVAAAAGVAVNALSWGCMWMDFNHDRLEDLHVSTQAVLVAQNINFLFQQNSDHTFNDVSIPTDIGNCFTSAKGDLNNDGYWDYADSFILPFRFAVWQNDGGTNHWMKIGLTGTESNRDAVGTKIRYWINGEEHYCHTFCGESFFSQDSQYEILSLGEATQVDSLLLQWPSGRMERYYNLAADQLHAFTEGDAVGSSILTSQATICPGGDTVTLSVASDGALLWFDGTSGSAVEVNAPGEYYALLTNACGYVDSLSVVLNASSTPTIEVAVIPPSCFGLHDGCMSVYADGVEPQDVLWQGPSIIAEPCTFGAGNYTYTFADAFGCSFSGDIQLTEPALLTLDAASTIICPATLIAANLAANGGTAPYSYTVLGGFDLGALAPGDYTAVVADSRGCEAQANFSIAQFPAVSLIGSADSVCFGQTTSLNYFGTGGALPYTYDWFGQNPNALAAGVYSFSIMDANGCNDDLVIEVGQYPAVEAQIGAFTNANGGSNGSMELSIVGGEAPFDILWNTGDTTLYIDSIGQGLYTTTVTDANGCVSVDSQQIIDLNVAEIQPMCNVFPNPSAALWHVQVTQASEYAVFSAQGQLLLIGRCGAGLLHIDGVDWPVGMYQLKLNTSTGAVATTLIKL